MYKVITSGFVALILFVSPPFVFSAFSFNINIAGDSASTVSIASPDQEIEITLNITDLPSESYFRISLQKEGGGSYYGYVKNNSGNWSAIQSLSGDCTGYYNITDTSVTSLVLRFKVGNDTALDNGSYKIKAHRFTKTCSSYTEAANNLSAAISFIVPSPSPSASPATQASPTPAPSPSPSPSPKASPSPTPKVSPSPSAVAAVIKSPSPKPKPSPSPAQEAVLAAETIQIEPSPQTLAISDEKVNDKSGLNSRNIIAFAISGLGLGLFALSGYLYFKGNAGKNGFDDGRIDP